MFKAFGVSEFAGRAPFVACAWISIALVYCAGRRFFGTAAPNPWYAVGHVLYRFGSAALIAGSGLSDRSDHERAEGRNTGGNR